MVHTSGAHPAHDARSSGAHFGSTLATAALYFVSVVAISTVFVFLVEALARGSFGGAFGFMASIHTGAWATVALVTFVLLALDAIFGRAYLAVCALGPLFLILPFANFEKLHYLPDPLVPTDLVLTRQIVDIGPLLVDAHPWLAITVAVGVIAMIAFVVAVLFVWRRHFPRIAWGGRLACLVVAVPPLLFFYSISDYSTFSWYRDRLQIIPMMWDQKANYDHNGFIMAFALNVPMSKIATPAGYGPKTMKAMQASAAVSDGNVKPDIIMVMSESFWDPTRLPGVTITPDPMPTVRSLQSGYMFSPEFGGMTANIEFEALTGFSNAFLPYGSIPYQQLIRRPMPSLARFFDSQGYVTRAIHPGTAWFWNRTNVYKYFGFDLFKSEENLPPIAKRGPLASDAALMHEVINEADQMKDPFFYFVVTLENHGPYEANRYQHTHVTVKAPGISDSARASAESYAEGVYDADQSLKTLVDWAKKRSRPTILVFFGDHLPPLGPVYVETGFLKQNVAPRKAPPADMLREHQTPLVIWSNRSGSMKTGTISPSLIPLQILKLAGMTHPYYTGFLGEVRDKYRVIDRQLLLEPDGKTGIQDWVGKKHFKPLIDQYRLIQYDVMFGKGYSKGTFFPSTKQEAPKTAIEIGNPSTSALLPAG